MNQKITNPVFRQREIKAPLLFSHHLTTSSMVILTSNIVMAKTQNEALKKNAIYDLCWISWIGDISDSELALLKGKSIYDFLHNNTDQSHEKLIGCAQRVNKLLEPVKPNWFKYISYMNGSPVSYTLAEYNELRSQTYSRKEYEHDLTKLKPAAKELMSPFLFEESVTLIHGRSEECTIFTTALAFCLSRKMKLIEGWKSREEVDVLYLCKEMGRFNLGKKFNLLKKLYSGEFEADAEFSETEVAPETSFQGDTYIASLNPKPLLLPTRQANNDDAGDFYWNIIDDNVNTVQNAEWIEHFVFDQVNGIDKSLKNSNKVLVLDGLIDITNNLYGNIRRMLVDLKKAGWTIIITADTSSKMAALLPFNNVIK